MAPKAKVFEQVAQVQAAAKALQLKKVKQEAWTTLREAQAELTLDLQVDIEHITPGKLDALAQSLEPLARCPPEVSAQLWQWFASPASGSQDGGLPFSRALLVILAQAISSPGDLLGPAGATYLALLAVQGSDQQWSLLFQPAIFQKVLRATRVLRRGDLKQKKEKTEAAAAEEGDPDEVIEEDVSAGDVGLLLLGKIVHFLTTCGLGASAEAAALTIDELALLVLKPKDDSIARTASAGLSGLCARGSSEEDTRRLITAVIRAVMSGVLMTQERHVSWQGAMPKALQHSRSTALKLICGLMRNHPQVLTPRPYVAEEEKDIGDEEEPVKKKSRRGPKGNKGEGEGDDEVEAVDGTQGEQATQEAGGEGGADAEKKVRRRRPKDVPVMEDPVVATLELLCISTLERAEWRGYAVESVLALLSEAADIERHLRHEDKGVESEVQPKQRKRVQGKSKESAGDTQEGPELPIDESGGAMVATGEPTETSGPPDACGRFMMFLTRILESERVAVRLLATEIAVGSLERSGRLAKGGAEGARAALVQKLLVALVRRCSDAVPTVRGCALGGVSSALQSLAKFGECTQDLLHGVVVDRQHPQFIDLPALFKSAALDEKPTARKSALNLFDTMMPLLSNQLHLDSAARASFFDLRLLCTLSADESILVRKASISSMAMLLRTCPLAIVRDLWVRNVLPLVLDVESSVAERALDELEATVVNPLCEQAPRKKNEVRGVPNQLSFTMPLVLTNLDSEATEYLQRGLKTVAKRNEGKWPAGFVETMSAICNECLKKSLPLSAWPVAVWSLLEEVTGSFIPGTVNFDMILESWFLFKEKSQQPGELEPPTGLGSKILRSLEAMVPQAPQTRMSELVDSLGASLASFTAPTSEILAMMSVIQTVEATWKAKKVYAQKAKERLAWRNSFLKAIQVSLVEAVRPAGAVEADVQVSRGLEASLFALGELALLDMSIISDGVITQVQTIATNTVYREGTHVDTCPAVRGQAFVTLGKCCLKKETLAKKTIELFVLHLRTSEPLVVRNNVLIVLGDLCIHYTSLVDRFVPCLTDLLRDNSELLRKQAAMTLASLLSEDFIKLRGSLLFRFLYTLSDPSDSVRNFVECVFARILYARNSSMFAQNFLDVICALNGWTGLASFRGAEGNEEFSLQSHPARRVQVYRFMLSLMPNDQKYNVCNQLITTLLATFVDAEDATPLPKTTTEPAGQALSDGLTLLCCKEMRICFTAQRAGENEEEEGDKQGADAVRGVLSSILKRNMADNIVPVLVQLKTMMEQRHSPFLKQLRHCLREILRDFKDNLDDIVCGDPQLAAEIAFDLQKEAANKDSQEDDSLGAPAKVTLPHLGGASRRRSLGTMMLRVSTGGPGGATPISDIGAPTPIAAGEGTPLKGGTPLKASTAEPAPGMGLPKSRLSVTGEQQSARKAMPPTPQQTPRKAAVDEAPAAACPPSAQRRITRKSAATPHSSKRPAEEAAPAQEEEEVPAKRGRGRAKAARAVAAGA